MAKDQKLLPAPKQPSMPVFLDEYAYYVGGRDDNLKEDLRKIEGVPNVTYLVKDGQVFVFDKLVLKVKEHGKLNPDVPLADLARSLIPLATISAKEAVEQWGIVPEPYEMVANPSGGLMIRHRSFNARLPGTFQIKYDVQEAFARLLVGDIQPGSGDFTYCGQPMTLCDPLDPALLPPRPAIQWGLEPANYVYTALGGVAYEPGFEPVSEDLFYRVQALEESWKNDSARAARHARSRAAEIWAQAGTLGLESLYDYGAEVPEYGTEDFAELRPLYPELSMLSDGSLFAWFDCYQEECCYISGWTASRDDDFLFYLLGKVAGGQYEREAAKEVGEWVAYALLCGDALDAALAFGRAASLYHGAISKLARRVADAMRFLAEDKKATDLRGHAITTMMDMFRHGRTFCGQLATATQDLSKLDDAGFHTLIFGPSRQGKPMLHCLTAEERGEWDQWMQANPGVNGMEWQGWAAVAKRQASAGGFVYFDGMADSDVGGLVFNVMDHGSEIECLTLLSTMTNVELTAERQEAGLLVIKSLPPGANIRDFVDAGKPENAQRIGLSAELVEALAPMLSALERWLEPGKYGNLFGSQQ